MARTLLGWGFRHITLLDNGNVTEDLLLTFLEVFPEAVTQQNVDGSFPLHEWCESRSLSGGLLADPINGGW